MKDGGWLDKYNDGGPVQPNYNDASVTLSDNFVGEGIINGPNWKSPAWGGQFQMGGSLPGATGFMYARVGAPSNGKYAKKTKASAQNGTELENAYAKWPALRNMGPAAVNKDYGLGLGLGYGGVEFMHPDLKEVNYDNGVLLNQSPGKNSTTYNPLTDNEQSVRLDMLHGMHQDPTFSKHRNAFKQSVLSDPNIKGDMDYWYNEDKKKGRAGDGREQWMNNYIDGQMRTLLFEGNRKSRNYSDEEASQLLSNPKIKKNFNKLNDYLKTGYSYSQGPKAENGTEMRYYQEGLDFKPKSISKNGSVIKDDRGQWDHPGEITEIGSNQITMQGVPYPVLGISDTGDMQMMYPNQEYQYDGNSVTEYPMMAEGGKTLKNKPLVNLGDFTMTPAELEYVNAPNSGYCPGGNCLENTKKGYDMTAGRVSGIPNSNDIWTKDLNLISTASRPSEKLIKENPYFEGDSSFGSADSWDIHGAIVKAGGKNIYSQAKGQAMPKDIAIGSFIGWGPAGTRESNHSNRQKGLNTKYGLQPSHHTTQVVSYNEQGEAIVYDSYLGKYGTVSDIAKDLKSSLGYELENISVPKSVAGNTRESLSKKGLLKNELTPYTADVNKLLSGTKQDWAQIKEDGKLRAPKPDREKLDAFAKALSDNKGELISSLKIKNEDYDRLANTALAIAMTESEGGGALGFADNFGSTQGMTQLNPNNIKNDKRLSSALNKSYKNNSSPTNVLDPSSSALATMMYLSVAEKDAKRLYDKGLKPGVKTFNQPGFIENFRSSNSRLNKDGVFIDELNKRIPYSEIPGYEDNDVTQVNNYLKKVTKSDKYHFVDKDGDLSLKMKTKGNNPKLTDIEKIGYMWQSPNSLKTGDAEGKSEYVNKIKNYYNLLSSNKMEQGGQLTKLDQLTNFTNYNTKQPGGWLDKYQ
jgi:hypothetical protein